MLMPALAAAATIRARQRAVAAMATFVGSCDKRGFLLRAGRGGVWIVRW
jgi:hypothetical protein